MHWRYNGRPLVALEQPTQDERYAYDERGLLATRTVVRRDDIGGCKRKVTDHR